MVSRDRTLFALLEAATGRGSSERCCATFVHGLLELRHVSEASVWVRRELLALDGVPGRDRDTTVLAQLCVAPVGSTTPEAVRLDHPLFVRATHEGLSRLTLPDPTAIPLVGDAAGQKGRLVAMPLGDMGYLLLRSDTLQHPLASIRLDDMNSVVAIFCGSLRAYLTTLELRRERTIRSRLADQIERQEDRFRALVDRMVDVVFIVDLDTKIRFANAATQRVLGHQPSELSGTSVLEFVPESDVAQVLAAIRRCISGAEVEETLQVRFLRRDGTPRVLDCLLHRALETIGVAGVVLSCHDVTEVEEARKAAESASAARERFLATMSHEVRTPMNGILGVASLLETTPLGEDQRELVQTIRTSAESLLTVINEILDFSRIESGAVEIEERPFDAVRLVEDAVAVVVPQAMDKGLDLRILVDREVPARFHGDPLRIRQVLLNLVSNAVKFTEEGSVTVELGTSANPAGCPVLEISVADTGEGIAPQRFETLFDPFVQAHASVARRHGGTGLGLSISRRLCELMGGGISVESTPGEGSTFRFWVPGPKTGAGPWWEEDPFRGFEGSVVALLTPDEVLARNVGSFLEWWGCEVIVSGEGGRKGVTRVLRKAPETRVALVDDALDGLSTAIRALENAEIPHIVFLSGFDSKKDLDAEAPGKRLPLTKPVGPLRLAAKLRRLLEGGGDRESAETAVEPESLGLRVLVADDNPVNRHVAVLMLHRLGCEVEVAEDGTRVLELLGSRTFDVVLMDVHMPELDGIGATRRIRSGPEYGTPRIIGMTALAFRGDRDRCIEAGMDGYIAKPLRLEDLRTVLQATEATPEEHHEPPESPGTVLDENRLETLVGVGGSELLRSMVELFEDYSARQVGIMEEALETGDARKMREAAHGLKGGSLNLGLVAVADLALSMERAAGTGELEEAGRLLPRVREALAEGLEALAVRVGATGGEDADDGDGGD